MFSAAQPLYSYLHTSDSGHATMTPDSGQFPAIEFLIRMCGPGTQQVYRPEHPLDKPGDTAATSRCRDNGWGLLAVSSSGLLFQVIETPCHIVPLTRPYRLI